MANTPQSTRQTDIRSFKLGFREMRGAFQGLLALVMLLTVGTSCAAAGEGSDNPVVGTGVGNYAPNFNLVDIDGEGVSLADFAGKPVLINFWASWCPPCRQEMPYLQEIYDEESKNGLILFAINIQESPAKVRQFLAENGLSLPVLFDLTGGTSGDYGIVPIPTTFFIDGKGVIKQKVVGAFPNKQAIEKELRRIMP